MREASPMNDGSPGSPKPSICIVSHDAYGALTGGQTGRPGGVEWQTSLTARWLASQGCPVSLLTWDSGQGPHVVDGVRVIPICPEPAGLPGLRFFHPRWTGLNRALARAAADVYYHNCGEDVTGQVALWCRLHRRPFVYSVASDPDCDLRLPHVDSLRERILYRYGLRHADRILVQTRKQQEMLWTGFGLRSAVIPMPCLGPTDSQYVEPVPPPPSAGRVAWVGRITEVKRLDVLLEIARVLPGVTFDVAGGFEEQRPYVQDLHQRARPLPNVILHGRIARDQMPAFYQRTSCLLCTSDYEGFPNTFLEAWSYGLPVVSTVDPDGLIARGGLGAVAMTPDGLVARLRRLLTWPELWRCCSHNAREYYLENHTLDVTMPRFEQVFAQAARGRHHAVLFEGTRHA